MGVWQSKVLRKTRVHLRGGPTFFPLVFCEANERAVIVGPLVLFVSLERLKEKAIVETMESKDASDRRGKRVLASKRSARCYRKPVS